MPGASSGYLPPVVADLRADAGNFEVILNGVKAQLLDFAKTNTQTRLGANTVLFQTDLLTAKTELLAFARDVKNARLGANAAPFWAEIAALRTQLAAMSPLDLKVDANVTQVLAQINALREAVALAQTGTLVDAGMGAGGIGGIGLKGGAAGGAGAAAAAGGIWTWIHAAHLFMPEIIGLAAALGSVVIGFTALGIAAAGTVAEVIQGAHAVQTAHDAILAAIPGTVAWTQGLQSLGYAWSSIPTNLQPAVHAITHLLSVMANSANSNLMAGFIGGQAGILTGLFAHAGSVFQPLIQATERAMVTVEGIISHSLGSGALSHLVAGLAKMVGPATVELFQMAVALGHIAAGFLKAVQGGRGLEMIVQLLRAIGTAVNSSLFQGFIAGWVDFDRIISTVLAVAARFIGVLASVGFNIHGVGVVVGFAVSALIAYKSALFLAGKAGLVSAEQNTALSGSLKSVIGRVAGVGLLAVGITGLASNISSLTHTSNPLSGIWHSIGHAIDSVSHAAGGAVSTIQGYRLQLSGSIPVTAQLSAAMDMLVRSEQSIGGSLAGLVQGFRPLTLTAIHAGTAISKVTDSVNTLISTLVNKNSDLATWAADAQILIKRGMDPSAVASLAQQAPQDLASMVTGTTNQLKQMNVAWQEQMLLAQMAGQNGIGKFVSALENGITHGTPVVHAAAVALATKLGVALKIPFTGSVASIRAIGVALQTIPTSVLADLAGKTHQYSAAMTSAAVHTAKAAVAGHSMTDTLISMGSNIAMMVAGLTMVTPAIRGLLTGLASLVFGEEAVTAASVGMRLAMVAASTTGILILALGIYELIHHFGLLKGLMLSGAVAVGALTIAFVALDAVPVVALIVAIGLAIVGLVAGVVYLATHWSQVWRGMEQVAGAVVAFIVTDVVKPVVDNFLWMAGAVVDAAAKAFGWVPGIGPKLKAAADAFNAFRAHVNATLTGWANDANHWGQQAGTNTGHGYIQGLWKQVPNVNPAAQQLTTHAINALRMAVPLANQAGASTGAGFIAGLWSMMPQVSAAAQQIAAHAINALHAAIMNPPYPSRVSMTLGESFGTGFAVGIMGTGGMVGAAAHGLAGAAITGVGLPGAYRMGSGGLGSGVQINAPITIQVSGASGNPQQTATAVRVEVEKALSQVVRQLRAGAGTV